MMTSKVVLGFDPSLTSSGFAYRRERTYCTDRIKAANLRGSERLAFIEESFNDILNALYTANHKVDLIALEGYSMGGKAHRGRLFDIGELGGLLKLVAWKRGIDVLLVPPTSLKLFAGSGKAQKPEIAQYIADRWGYRIPQNDEADAFVLLKMGEAFIGESRHALRVERNRKALAGCQILSSSS